MSEQLDAHATQVMGEIREALQHDSLFDLDQLKPGATIDECGIDSLLLNMIFIHFERRYSIEFDNDNLDPQRYDSIEDLARNISAVVRSS